MLEIAYVLPYNCPLSWRGEGRLREGVREGKSAREGYAGIEVWEGRTWKEGC
jgi:hypothetical protein